MTGAAGSKYGDGVSVRLCLRARVNVCVGVGVGVCALARAGHRGNAWLSAVICKVQVQHTCL